ncbi:hypothetical protein ACHAXA_008858 [Cyclostephanos tholiformis]|uniref:ATP synthase protein I n=1 Tax=Cyclostephanos tholiformis TaxID=382380 RepID=A0ABD3SGE1_9STRA
MIAQLLLWLTIRISSHPPALAFAPTQICASCPRSLRSPPRVGYITVGDSDGKSIRRIGHGAEFTARKATAQFMKSVANDDDGVDVEVVDARKNVRDEIFWAKQRALAAEMSAKTDDGLRRENREKFARRRLALTSDTFYFSILIGSLLWIVSPNPFVAISYLFGALSGTAYSYGLGKYVESIGGSIDDADVEGAGIGQARFAFLILLFVVVGKFRSQGLLELPSIMGFFTYQLASLSQGLREIDD